MSGSVVGALRVTLGIDTAAFEEGLGIAQKRLAAASKSLQKVGDSMADLGSKLSVAVTAPLLAAGAAAVKGAQAQAQAMAQVNAALESMGPVAGRTAEQLLKASDALELNSLFDGDEILKKVTANLLTFGNVAGEQFDRAQQAAVDLATRMDTDLQSATILIGKALNDPIKGMTALSKAGIQFSADQKAAIAAMVQTGDIAGAQRIILRELEKQFKGAAQAAAETDPWRKAQVAIGQAGDEIGNALLPVIQEVAGFIDRAASAFNKLSPEAKGFAVAAAAVAAVVGPVVVVLGSLVSAIGAIAPVFAPVLTLITGAFGAGGVFAGAFSSVSAFSSMLSLLAGAFAPVVAAITPFLIPVAAVAALGALIYANWDKIAPVLETIGGIFQTQVMPKVTEAANRIGKALSELWQGPFGNALREVGVAIGKLGEVFGEFATEAGKVFGPIMARIFDAFIIQVTSIFTQIGLFIEGVSKLLTGDFAGAWEAAKQMVATSVQGTMDVLKTLAPEAVKAVSDMVTGVRQWVVDRLSPIWDTVINKIELVKKGFFDLYDAVVGNSYVPDMVDGIGVEFARLQSLMVEPANKATSKVTEATRQMASDVSALLDRLFPEFARARKLQEELAQLDRAGLNDDLRRRARLRLITEGQGDAPVSAGLLNTGPLIDFDKQLEELQAGLAKTANGAKVQTVQIAESFRDMADKSIQALDRMVSAIKGGDFLDILGSVINLGLQLGSMGVFGKKVQTSINAPQLPGFATGGSFTVGGRPGRDANVVAFRATRGEHVQISTSEAAAINRAGAFPVPGAPMNITVTPSPYFDVAVDGRIVQAAPSVAGAGAALAQSQMEQKARRRFR